MVIEVKLAVTGMAAYDYDLRLCRSIPKAGHVSKHPTHQSSSIFRSWPSPQVHDPKASLGAGLGTAGLITQKAHN